VTQSSGSSELNGATPTKRDATRKVADAAARQSSSLGHAWQFSGGAPSGATRMLDDWEDGDDLAEPSPSLELSPAIDPRRR
jgi:hypothetical protein